MNYNAKQALWNLQPTRLPRGQAFPLEPVYFLAGPDKITADMGHHVKFLAHRTLARTNFHKLDILDPTAFDKVDWEMVHQTLHEVPRMIQQRVCKQVTGIAGTMEWDKSVVRKCPSCMQHSDTCAHVLFCEHAGRVATMHHTVDLLEDWLEESGTDPDLLDCIAEYAYSRGGRTMVEICNGLGEPFHRMAWDQDEIG
jgi:hypothetical protein